MKTDDLETTNPQSPVPRPPLTDPADILALVGRFGAAMFLFLLTMALLFVKRYEVAILTGGASLLLQLTSLRLWRRLREERIARAAEREAAEAASGQESAL